MIEGTGLHERILRPQDLAMFRCLCGPGVVV